MFGVVVALVGEVGWSGVGVQVGVAQKNEDHDAEGR